MNGIIVLVANVLELPWVRVAAAFGLAVVMTAVLILVVHQTRQQARLARLFSAEGQGHLFDHVDEMSRSFSAQTQLAEALRGDYARLEARALGFFDTVDIEHYDAFPGQAGKFSFSLLMLNRNGSGVILTSLTNTQGSKVYVKRIETGKSDTALSREEQDVLSRHARS
jgi:hypothetical protein